MDHLADLMADQKEIDDALEQGNDRIQTATYSYDDDQLEKELDLLMEAEALASTNLPSLPTVPSHIPSSIEHEIAERPTMAKPSEPRKMMVTE